jgi:hypothetical protein
MATSVFTMSGTFAPAGHGLASLAASNLERRFYSWLGKSGQRYVCTVFRNGDDETLSSFVDASIVGVAHRDEVRRPVCVLAPSDFDGNGNVRAAAAIALGVNEWHVHFLTGPRELAVDLGCQ